MTLERVPTNFIRTVRPRGWTAGRPFDLELSVFRRLTTAALSLSLAATLLAAAPTVEKAAATPVPSVAPAAAPVPAAVMPKWNAKSSLIFNNARGKSTKRNRAAEYRIISQINKGLNYAQPRSTVTLVMYLFNIQSTADAIVRAKRRGVNVQFLIDDGTNTKQSRQVKRALGTNKRAQSFYATCRHSCMSNGASTIHVKFYLFSNVGYNQPLSMISSANPHKVNTIASWNNIHTIANNATIYSHLRRYFVDMLRDRTNRNYYATHPPVTSGPYKLFFYPRAVRRASDVAMLDVLNHTGCRTAAGGATTIRVEMWGWTSTRKDIAQRLYALHSRGCKIQVIINRARISRGIVNQLLKRNSRYGQIKVYDAWHDKNKNDFGELYMHHKAVMISGRWFGRDTKVTYTGSQNFTPVGTTDNNDMILRVMGASTYNAYAKNMDYIKQHSTKRLTKTPRVLRDTYGPGDQRVKGAESKDVSDSDLLELQDR